MAKKVYVGVDDVARRVKKMYVGVDGTARKVKKGYVGVGGVARPFFTTGLERWGLATSLTTARTNHAATTVGDYALFGGGSNNSGAISSVETYNKSLVKGTATNISGVRRYLGASNVGNYALFAGGGDNGGTVKADVATYNQSLTKGTATAMTMGGWYVKGTNFQANSGSLAMFTQGVNIGYEASTYSNVVDTYNASLTKGTVNMSVEKTFVACASTDKHVLFAGGMNSSGYTGVVDAFNKSLSRTTPAGVGAYYGASAASVGEYIIVTGYYYDAYAYVYNSSLTRTIITNVTKGEYRAAITLGDYALFGGSRLQGTVVDAFDKSLTVTKPNGFSESKCYVEATTIGNYALFGGGQVTRTPSAKVEVYCI